MSSMTDTWRMDHFPIQLQKYQKNCIKISFSNRNRLSMRSKWDLALIDSCPCLSLSSFFVGETLGTLKYLKQTLTLIGFKIQFFIRTQNFDVYLLAIDDQKSIFNVSRAQGFQKLVIGCPEYQIHKSNVKPFGKTNRTFWISSITNNNSYPLPSNVSMTGGQWIEKTMASLSVWTIEWLLVLDGQGINHRTMREWPSWWAVICSERWTHKIKWKGWPLVNQCLVVGYQMMHEQILLLQSNCFSVPRERES